MADSLSIPPVALSGLAGIPSVAFQLLTTSAPTASASSLTDNSNLIELSGTGLLLSAVSSFENDLQALQTRAADSNPSALFATAQGLVDAFNSLQADTASLQTVFATQDNTLAAQLTVAAFGELTTTSITSSNANLSALQSIGIELQTSTAPTTLSIDQNVLNTAIGNAPAGTQALLATATQSLIDQAGAFESAVAGSVVAQANLTQLGSTALPQPDLSNALGQQTTSSLQEIAVATDLLPNLSADSALNATQLSELDLTARLDAGAPVPEDGLAAGALAAALLRPDGLTTLNGSVGATNPRADAATPTTNTAPAPSLPVETPVTTAPAVNAASPDIQVATTTTAPTDAIAADRRTSEATLALQAQVADPGLRAINNFSDPVFAALIAASHLSDFISPSPTINPEALASDALAPVSPAPVVYGIAYYKETASDTWKQFVKPGPSQQWFA